MALVLCAGVEGSVLETRKLLLEAAGHIVVTAMDEMSLVDACGKNAFDVAVIGQMISPNMKGHVASLVKRHRPEIKLLELYAPHTGRTLEWADSWLMVPPDSPRELVDEVDELAGKEKSNGATA